VAARFEKSGGPGKRTCGKMGKKKQKREKVEALTKKEKIGISRPLCSYGPAALVCMCGLCTQGLRQ